MEVGEQDLAGLGAQTRILRGDRLFDLQHEVRRTPHVVRGTEDLPAGGDEVLVRDGGAHSGILLHEHLVTGDCQLVHAGRGDGDPELVVLDLARDSDLHLAPPSGSARRHPGRRARRV
jgi:hypothetical protein